MGVFANALTIAAGQIRSEAGPGDGARHGLAGWLLERIGHSSKTRPRLALVERISLAPRQTVSLLEVDGQKLLIATAPESSPSFCLLNPSMQGARRRLRGEIPIEGIVG